jgi:hypothetical protein
VSAAGSTKLPGSVTISTEALATPIGESLMILDLRSGVYFELEGVGARIWQFIAEEKTPAQIAHLISDEYHIDEATAAADLADLIGELSASGLLSIGAERDPWQV